MMVSLFFSSYFWAGLIIDHLNSKATFVLEKQAANPVEKAYRFWTSVALSSSNGTFVFQHFVPSNALSISQRTYLTVRTSACSETGRVLKFGNITSSKSDLGRLNFVNPKMMPQKLSYQLTGRALCCKAPMQNKQVIIEMLEASTDKTIWSKTVSTNDNGHFSTSVNIVGSRDKNFDFKITPIGRCIGSRLLYRKFPQENKILAI